MDPPAVQRYLRLSRGKVVAANDVAPFQAKWQLDKRAGRKALGLAGDELAPQALDESISHLALALDSIVNNTSLVLLFDFRANPPLPGRRAVGQLEGLARRPGLRALLSQVSFLKVAHHGSHNATPRRALEGMTTGPSRPWSRPRASPGRASPAARS